MFSSKRTVSTALILTAASTFTACGGGGANSSNSAIPNTPAIQSVASASVSSATPIQILSYNGYFYPWSNFSAGASVIPYLASVGPARAIIISAGQPSRPAYSIELESGKATFVESTVNGSVTLKAPNTKIIPGNTYFILGTYDGSEARLYVNGSLSASAPLTGGLWNDQTTGEAIGADVNSNNPFNGIISDVTILPSTITPTPNPYAAPTIRPTIAPTPMQTLAPTPTPRPTVAPTPTISPNPPEFAPASVSLFAVGSTASAELSEENYSGGFSVSSNCPSVATVAQSGKDIAITATGAGNCSITASDENGQEAILPVTVTVTDLQFQ